MKSTDLEVCYLVSLIVMSPEAPVAAICGLVALALARSPRFWGWLGKIQDITFKGINARFRGR